MYEQPQNGNRIPSKGSTTGSLCGLMGKKMNYILAVVDVLGLYVIGYYLYHFYIKKQK
jgi:hypothetical protein